MTVKELIERLKEFDGELWDICINGKIEARPFCVDVKSHTAHTKCGGGVL